MKQLANIKVGKFSTNLVLYTNKGNCIKDNIVLLPKKRAEYNTDKELDQNVIIDITCNNTKYYTCCTKYLWHMIRRNDFFVNNVICYETNIILNEQ